MDKIEHKDINEALEMLTRAIQPAINQHAPLKEFKGRPILFLVFTNDPINSFSGAKVVSYGDDSQYIALENP